MMMHGAWSSLVTRWETRAALRKARRFGRAHPAKIRVCWDLDNTLANSGALLRTGSKLQDAIVSAEPVVNMLAFYARIGELLPEATHFILSARTRSMRGDTLVWLGRHGLDAEDGAVCFVPSAEIKPRVWERLARGSQLVIVDDLSYGHEEIQPSIYRELVDFARQTARVYVGFDEIARIAADADAIDEVAAAAVAVLDR
jgi:hypothetical protein